MRIQQQPSGQFASGSTASQWLEESPRSKTSPRPRVAGSLISVIQWITSIAADLECALSALSPEDRMMIRLRYEADLTNLSVATALGLSVANVKVRLHRQRPQLEDSLSMS